MNVAQTVFKKHLIESIPHGYSFKSAYYVELSERFAIDGYLLGKRIRLHYGKVLLSIVFPSIIKRNPLPILGVPGLIQSYGIDTDNWGTINNYQDLDKPETVCTWLSTVFIECFAKEADSLLDAKEVQALAKKVVYALQIINPEAIRSSLDEVLNDVCNVKFSVSYNEEWRPQVSANISFLIDDIKKKICIRDLILAISCFYKSVSAPYELLGNARMNLSRHDVRAAVLNCATAIEVSLKKKIQLYLEDNHTTSEIQVFVLKRADGYTRMVDLCKRLKISLGRLPNVKETVFNIRNRVIHGGYVPSIKEANTAYQCTREVLNELKMPMFE